MSITPIAVTGNAPVQPLTGLGQSAGLGDFFSLLGAFGNVGEAPAEGGLSSLISSLLGQNAGQGLPEGLLQQGFPEGLGDVLARMRAMANQLAQAFPQALAQPVAADAEGFDGQDISAVQAFRLVVVEVEITVTQFRAANIDVDGITDADELARAYQKLGLSAEDAQNIAGRIMAALAVMDILQNGEAGLAGLSENLLQSTGLRSGQGSIADGFARSASLQVTQFELRVAMADGSFGQGNSAAAAFNASSTLSDGDLSLAVLRGARLDGQPAEGEALLNRITTSAGQAEGQAERQVGENGLARGLLKDGQPQPGQADARAEAALRAARLQGEGDQPAPATQRGEQGLARAADAGDHAQQPRQAAEALASATRPATTAEQPVAPPPSPAQLRAERAERRGAAFEPVAEASATESRINRNDGPAVPAAGRQVLTMQPSATPGAAPVLVDATTGQPVTDAAGEVVDDALEGALNRNQASEARADFKQNNLAQVARQAQVAVQVSTQVRTLATHGGGQVRMTLNPPELGMVNIRMEVVDGRVKGTIVVQSPEVIDQLARDLRNLQQGLAAAGLELDEEGFQFLLHDDNAGEDDDDNNTPNGHSGPAAQGMMADAATGQPGWQDPDRLIDVAI